MRRAPLLALLLLALTALPAATAEFSTVSWFEGAEGMERAIDEARRYERPLLVYFRTDWCGYCRQFERDLLGSDEVEIFVEKLVAVTINPEAGPDEARIASAYGVRGYPAIFMHPPGPGAPRQIQRMVVQNGRPRLQTPLEFVQTLSRAAHDG